MYENKYYIIKVEFQSIPEANHFFSKNEDLLIKKSNKTNILQMIDDFRKKIKTFRQSGLEQGGEYSYENLTFKMLRRNGSIKMLLDLQTTNTNNKLSITQ